jgi:Ca2+-binding RTX toxin-like protein
VKLALRVTFGGALSLAVLATAVPASASFASVGSRNSGTQVQVSGNPGEANDIEVTLVGSTYMITDTAGIIAGPGCSGGGTVVTCPDPMGTVLRVVVAPADGADVAVLDATIPSLMSGGPGPDRLVGGPLRDRMLGRGDADRLSGRGGDDRLTGNARGDVLNGGAGEDRLQGDQGPDRIRARDGERDSVNGGAGTDRARIDPQDRVRRVEQIV